MKKAGLAVELLETRHASDAFKAMPVKSDRNDARNIAQLMRLGRFRPVHCKSMSAQEIRATLTARKPIPTKLQDVENSLGILRGFGLKVGKTTKRSFATRIGELVAGHPALEAIAAAMFVVHMVLLREFDHFDPGAALKLRLRPGISLRSCGQRERVVFENASLFDGVDGPCSRHRCAKRWSLVTPQREEAVHGRD